MKLFQCLLVCLALCGCSNTTTSPSLTDLFGEIPPLEGGVWKMSCRANSSGDYQINVAFFDQGSYRITSSYYSAPGCSSNTKIMEIIEAGSYSQTASSSSSMARLDRNIVVVNVKPTLAAAVSTFNSLVYCGISDWSLDVARDVIANCSGYRGYSLPRRDTTIYDLAEIALFDSPAVPGIPGSQTYRGDLTFGYFDVAHDGLTPSARPNSLNGNNVYRRQ